MAVRTFSRAPGVLWRRSPWSVLALRTEPGAEVISLAGSATTLWDLLAVPMSTEELVVEVARHYGLEPTAITVEIESALDTLVTLKLVEAD